MQTIKFRFGVCSDGYSYAVDVANGAKGAGGVAEGEYVRLEDHNARVADLKAENERLTELLRGDRMVVATRINHELTVANRRIAELEAAINGCAGQWTPMPEGAHYCGCNDEDCAGEWRIENGGSRMVIGDGESELSVEFYDAIRVCWQVK